MDHDADPTVPATERPAPLSDPYTFCNCGRAGCPAISTDSSGNVVIDEELKDLVDRGETRSGIVFQPAQARELFVWLRDHGHGS